MTVLAFGLVAQSAGWGIAAQIAGGIVFSYIDSNFIMPGIFGGDQVQPRGSRIEDLSVQGTKEGTPSKFVLGTSAKISGQVIWATDLTPSYTEVDGGGGGGKGGAQAANTVGQTTYSMSVAIRICDTDGLPEETPGDGLGGRISRVLKVWANGKEIYNYKAIDPDTGFPTLNDEDRYDNRYDNMAIYYGNQTTTDPTIDASMNFNFWNSTESEQNASVNNNPTPTYKGSAYVVINDLQLNDFGNRLPNFEFLIEATNEETDTGITDGEFTEPRYYTYRSALTQVCERAGMPATDFDVSRIPSPLNPEDYSIAGIQSAGDQESARIIEHLMLAGNLIPREDNGVLVFEERGTQPPVTLNPEQFGSFEFGKDGRFELPFWREEVYDVDLPKRVAVSFDDAACNYDRGVRIASKLNTTNSNERKIDLPMTLTDTQASLIAQRALWSIWGVRDQVEGTLPASNIALNPGDLIRTTLTDSTSTWTEYIRLEKVSRGLNWSVQFRGRIEEPDIFTQSVIESPRNCIPGTDPFNSTNQVLQMIVTNHMIAPYQEGAYWPDTEDLTFFATWRDQQGGTELGRTAAVGVAEEEVATYRRTVSASPVYARAGQQWCVQGKMATLSGSLPAAGPENGGLYWNRKDSFLMVVADGASWQPITETEESVLNGANTIVIQENDLNDSNAPEVLAFRDVSIESGTPNTGVPVTYRCSHLLRGLRGTHHNATLNRSGSQMIAFYPDFVIGHPLKTPGGPRWGARQEFYAAPNQAWWKVIPLRRADADFLGDRQDLIAPNETWKGIMRPFPMSDGRVVRAANGNFYIYYIRQTRNYHRGLGRDSRVVLPAPTDAMTFVLDIFDNPSGAGIGGAAPGDTVTRSMTVSIPFSPVYGVGGSDAPLFNRRYPILTSLPEAKNSGFIGWEYTAAHFAADGYADGDPIKCIAYQMNTRYGIRGWPSTRQLLSYS